MHHVPAPKVPAPKVPARSARLSKRTRARSVGKLSLWVASCLTLVLGELKSLLAAGPTSCRSSCLARAAGTSVGPMWGAESSSGTGGASSTAFLSCRLPSYPKVVLEACFKWCKELVLASLPNFEPHPLHHMEGHTCSLHGPGYAPHILRRSSGLHPSAQVPG
jgi:hypothetical protein